MNSGGRITIGTKSKCRKTPLNPVCDICIWIFLGYDFWDEVLTMGSFHIKDGLQTIF